MVDYSKETEILLFKLGSGHQEEKKDQHPKRRQIETNSFMNPRASTARTKDPLVSRGDATSHRDVTEVTRDCRGAMTSHDDERGGSYRRRRRRKSRAEWILSADDARQIRARWWGGGPLRAPGISGRLFGLWRESSDDVIARYYRRDGPEISFEKVCGRGDDRFGF